jgi:hypothetical protein
MFGVDLYGRVRLAVLGQGLSQREAARRFGIDRGTVAKMVSHSAPPGYRRALVRYKNTDYSVPVAYAHRDVMVKAYVDDVVITSGADEIARHRRSYDAGDFVFNPLHYLALLEQKVGALDQAAPLQGWSLPTEFATLRRLLEARLSQKNRCAAGKREYVQILRLIEAFPLALVHGAVRDALRLGAISYDAVKHLALCRIEKRPARLDLARYPHLALTAVATTSASSYMSLLAGETP